ncbi:MAG: DUF4147 domain-containing protein [Candidatus Micrarchaeota archaeon]
MPLRIKNERALEKAKDEREAAARCIALGALKAAIESLEPKKLVLRKIKKNAGGGLRVAGASGEAFPAKRVFVIGAGKAAAAMAAALAQTTPLAGGVVSIPPKTRVPRIPKIRFIRGGHPLPTQGSLRAGEAALRVLRKARRGDLVVCMISGGGSALLELPRKGLTLASLRKTTEALLRSGATINELNAVRKHLSRIKGGQLAAAAPPGVRLLTLVISDVLGSPLDVIAGGPTVADSTTFVDAKRVLAKRGFWKNPALRAARVVIECGLRGEEKETPKKLLRSASKTIVLADNDSAIDAAAAFLRGNGLKPRLLHGMHGEARVAGARCAALLNKRVCFVAGGETTVTVRGNGRGGRNQELVLSALFRLKSQAVIASIGTDGIDGFSEAAGAIASDKTFKQKRRGRFLACECSAVEFLARNDSNSFFKRAGGEIVTGATGTNACDVCIGIPY